ncbi:phage tail protein, partial [Ginsengibacter hankyongi]
TTICSNGTATVSGATATNGTILWTTSNGGGTISNATTLTPTYSAAGGDAGKTVTLTMTVTGTATCSIEIATATYSIKVNEPINISTQPNPSQAVCLTFPVSFSVAATGTTPTYQWKLNGNPISGATSSTYSISQAKAADAGTYTVDVIGAGGCATVTSDDAKLIVNQTITFNSQPSAVSLCQGGDATFTVSASGTITEYQWRKNNIPLSDGGNISGSTTTSLTITGATGTDAGSYDVVISGPAGQCSQAISNPATLTLNTPTTIGTQPTGATYCQNGSATALTVAAT